MAEPYQLDADEEIVREIERAKHIQNGLVADTAFDDLFTVDGPNPGGSSCVRLKLNATPQAKAPRDALAQAQVSALPRGLVHGSETWEAFAASITDQGQTEDHAEVRARRETDAPSLAVGRPDGNGKAAKAFRKLVRMKVALAFRPL